MTNDQTDPKQSIRLLIADDNTAARAGLKALLESVSIYKDRLEIFEASDGQEALAVMEQALPEIVLIDAQMPRLDGLETTRTIKQRWPKTRVIMLTMYDQYQQQALEAGVDLFLLKGKSPEMLLAAIFPPGSPVD